MKYSYAKLRDAMHYKALTTGSVRALEDKCTIAHDAERGGLRVTFTDGGSIWIPQGNILYALEIAEVKPEKRA